MSLSAWAWLRRTWCDMTYEQVKMAAFANELTKLARLAALKGGTSKGTRNLIGTVGGIGKPDPVFKSRYFRIGR